MTVKRCFDVVAAATGLVVLAPLFAAVAVAIRISDGGPCLFRARRVGRHGSEFAMHKFRTMHVDQGPAPSRITSPADPRVSGLGAMLRRLKLDELPELYDVLRGRMSLVGPRPEDPHFVFEHYEARDMVTLRVRPGLTSPASLYDYTHGEALLAGGDVERRYVERLLPVRLALEALYVEEAGFWYDLRIIGRSLALIGLVALGRTEFEPPPELARIAPE